MKKIKKHINVIVLLVFTFLVLYFSLRGNFNQIINQIFTMNILYLFIALLLFIVFLLLKSFPIYTFCKKINNDFKYLSSVQLTLRTQFVNAITPFSAGGQPYQIYYLKKFNIDYATSTSIVLENFIVYQIAMVLVGVFALVLNRILNIFSNAQFLQNLITLGFIINVLILIIMFIVAFSQKLNKFIISTGIKILIKLRIIKNKEETLKKWDKNIKQFHKSAKILLKDKKNFILNIFCNFLALIILYLVPLIILFSMGDFTSFNALVSIIACAYVMIISSFVPVPGATGGIEFGFIQFFGNFITGSKLSALMLVWRFVTYYFILIIGAIALNIKKVK